LRLSYWLMSGITRFDQTIRLTLAYVGREERVSCDKAKRELGWSMRPVEQTFLDTGRSMIEYGIVPRRGGRRRVGGPLPYGSLMGCHV
jgi:dihydroflavonol-4-reductase